MCIVIIVIIQQSMVSPPLGTDIPFSAFLLERSDLFPFFSVQRVFIGFFSLLQIPTARIICSPIRPYHVSYPFPRRISLKHQRTRSFSNPEFQFFTCCSTLFLTWYFAFFFGSRHNLFIKINRTNRKFLHRIIVLTQSNKLHGKEHT